MVTVNENISFTDYTSGLRLPNCFKLAINSKNDNDFTNFDITPSSDFSDIAVFFFSSLVTGQSFKSISLLVLELLQFIFIKVDQKFGNRKHPHWNFV